MMMKHIQKRRWGLPGGHPKRVYPPLDQAVLDAAITKLGDAALRNQESVKERVFFIVGLHRAIRGREENPPRPKDVRSNLAAVSDSAKQLRTQIAALDYLSLRELRQQNFCIDTVRVSEGLYKYILRSEPDTPTPLPSFERKPRGVSTLPLFPPATGADGRP